MEEYRLVDDIEITTKTHYEGYKANDKAHIFSYQITIENLSIDSYKLIHRFWHISDGLDWNKEVNGEGVVGEQPVLYQAGVFSYSSWCPTPSPITRMNGYFVFENVKTLEKIRANVPEMLFVIPDLRN